MIVTTRNKIINPISPYRIRHLPIMIPHINTVLIIEYSLVVHGTNRYNTYYDYFIRNHLHNIIVRM